MTREQRLVTLAFAALVVVVVLALAGRATATPPTPIGQLSERLFEPVVVSPAPRPAAYPTDSLSGLGRSRRPTGAPENDGAPAPVATPAGATSATPTDPGSDAAPSVGQPADRSAPPLALSRGQATWYDDGPGFYAAVGDWHFGDDPYPVAVCTAIAGTSRCVTVTVRDYCAACADGIRLIDLSHPDDPIAALKDDLDAFRSERLEEAKTAEQKPSPPRRPSGMPTATKELLAYWAAEKVES